MIITPPPSWTTEPPPSGVVEMYASPKTADDGPRVVLYATTQTKHSTDRDALARAAIDDLHETARRAELTGKVAVDRWEERGDAGEKLVEATLVYRDLSAHTLDTRRLVIVADYANLVAVMGECFSRDDADPKLLAACTSALATLVPGVPAAKRVALALAPHKSDDAPLPPVPDRPVPPTRAPPDDEAAPSMSDGARQPMPPMAVAPASPSSSLDKRPIFVGAAVLMLGFGLWWNRKRRAEIEREMGGGGDDDADDLHAAAKDDEKKP